MYFLTCRSLIAFNWWLCGLFVLTAFIGLAVFQPNIPWAMALGFIPFALFGAAIAFYYSRRNDPRPALLGTAFAQMIVFIYVGLLLSYVFASLNMPYQDALLLKIDRAIGFDWMTVMYAVNKSEALTFALATAYNSIGYQLAVVIFVLAITGQDKRMMIYICALGLSIAIVVVISGFVPALSYTSYLQIPPTQFRHTGITEEYIDFLKTLEILRSHNGAPIELHGIVTFPSFHTTSAMLYMWALWRAPYVRWVSLVVNSLMVASTPVYGNHYLVDVAAGIAVMAFTVWVAKKLQYFFDNKPILTLQT